MEILERAHKTSLAPVNRPFPPPSDEKKVITIHLDSSVIPPEQIYFFTQKQYCELRHSFVVGCDISLVFSLFNKKDQNTLMDDYHSFSKSFARIESTLSVILKCELMNAGLNMAGYLESIKIQALEDSLSKKDSIQQLEKILASYSHHKDKISEYFQEPKNFMSQVSHPTDYFKLLTHFPEQTRAFSDMFFHPQCILKMPFTSTHVFSLLNKYPETREYVLEWLLTPGRELDTIICTPQQFGLCAKLFPEHHSVLYELLSKPDYNKKMIWDMGCLFDFACFLPAYKWRIISVLDDPAQFIDLTRCIPNLLQYTKQYPTYNELLFRLLCKPEIFHQLPTVMRGYDAQKLRECFPSHRALFVDCFAQAAEHVHRQHDIWREPIGRATFGMFRSANVLDSKGSVIRNCVPKEVAALIGGYLSFWDGTRLMRTCRSAFQLATGNDIKEVVELKKPKLTLRVRGQ